MFIPVQRRAVCGTPCLGGGTGPASPGGQFENRCVEIACAVVAHELRNALSPIIHALGIMRMEPREPATVEWAQKVAERKARDMSRLIDDLLDLARLSRGMLRLCAQPVDLNELVARAVESSQPAIDARGQVLVVDLPRRPLWVETDPVRLEQVLINLFTNAAKHGGPNGLIRVTVVREGAGVQIGVQDGGTGIAPDLLPRVFDLFAQAQPGAGLGIGLALVRNLVEALGGSIQAHSEGLGHGSEFVVRLPGLASAPRDEQVLRAEGPIRGPIPR
jgi:signal transduction histidine kinase